MDDKLTYDVSEEEDQEVGGEWWWWTKWNYSNISVSSGGNQQCKEITHDVAFRV